MFNFKQAKVLSAAALLCLSVTGCMVGDFVAKELGVGGVVGFFASAEEVPELPREELNQLKAYGPSMSCQTIGNTMMEAKQLYKKGMSEEDIYWELSSEKSNYLEQSMYVRLIELGIEVDTGSAKPKSGSNIHADICRNKPEVFQELFDQSALLFYKHVDSIYTTVQNNERKNYLNGGDYGGAKSEMYKIFVTTNAPARLDPVTNEVINMISERVLEIVYNANIKSYRSIPDINMVRRTMASELILNVKK